MVIALISGIVLSAIFFGGLWFTVQKTLGKSNAAIWILVSSISRLVIVLTGFYFIAQGSWQRLLLAVAGFITARFFILRFTKQLDQKQAFSSETNQP